MTSTFIKNLARLAATAGVGVVLGFTQGCSNSPTDAEGINVSEQAHQEALAKTAEVITAERAAATASLVQDLTGGLAQGLASEAAGLDMELGTELPEFSQRAEYGISTRLARAERNKVQLAQKMALAPKVAQLPLREWASRSSASTSPRAAASPTRPARDSISARKESMRPATASGRISCVSSSKAPVSMIALALPGSAGRAANSSAYSPVGLASPA